MVIKMAKKQEFDFNYIPPLLEKKIWISEEEYHELLITKGKYEELKAITDKIFSLLTPNEIKNIVKFDHLLKKKDIDKI